MSSGIPHTPKRAQSRFVSFVGVLLSLVGVLAGCSGSTSNAKDTKTDPAQVTTIATPSGNNAQTTTLAPTVTEQPAEDVYVPAPRDEYIVVTATTPTVRVYDSASGDTIKTTLENPLPSGAPLTFLVDGYTVKRYKVLLPIRPNGSVGWVEPAEVGIKQSHKYRIEIELSKFNLKVFNGDEQLFDEKIGVGTSDTPTPGGRYYIKELLQTKNPNGIYGPYAYGLSGYSPVLQTFNGGDGNLGIHGTNEPDKLGTNVSHGCIRVKNESITKLSKILPLGTPVIIRN